MIPVLAFATALLWQAPVAAVESVDFQKPAGHAACPSPPFTFLYEVHAGSSAKVMVRDASGVEWQVKGGPEARADAFATRLAGALGYFAETVCFVAQGRFEGLTQPLRRASGFVKPDGSFTWASFERRDPDLTFLKDQQWLWKNNPFTNSPEFKGLKILIMLLSNWDNKDASNAWQGPNTGILRRKDGAEQFFITDWGQSLGAWRGLLVGSPWDCAYYLAQTRAFLKSVRGDQVVFGYRGQHTAGFSDGIRVEDVTWLMQYLGRITDAQIKLGLAASGATSEEEECFCRAIRERIEQLRRVTKPAAASALR